MNEARLRQLLREARVPDPGSTEARSRRVVLAAFEDHRGRGWTRYSGTSSTALRSRRARFALALAIVTLLAALLLSPAGASVRHWIGDAFTAGVPGADRDLSGVPGGGELLVQSRHGPWVVDGDGSRRLLGRYDAAAWSPRGLFVAVGSGRTLTAVEPDGTPHWSITAPARVADPRWSPSGYRIAYRAGDGLRALAGDGSGDHLIAPAVAPVPPAWSPLRPPTLAYVDTGGQIVLRDADSGRALATAPALPRPHELEWSGSGDEILEASATAIRLRAVHPSKREPDLRLGPPQRIPIRKGGKLRQAALSPDGGTLADLVELGHPGSPREEVDLIDPRAGTTRRIFAAASRLGQIAWSPDGRRLLITWPGADQWLFVPVSGRGRIHAVAGISRAFSPGSRGAFPTVEGWCCRR
jgi:hypothetical protein